jgi:hypothetical protein
MVLRKDLAAEPPDDVLGPQAAQALEPRVDEEQAPVDRLAGASRTSSPTAKPSSIV